MPVGKHKNASQWHFCARAMMTGFGERLKAAADRIGGLDGLAEKIPEMSRRSLSDYVSEKTDPRAALVRTIASVTGVDAGWLLVGEGHMLQKQGAAASPSALDVDRLELAIATVERGLDEADRVAAPDVKAGMISAAYEILTEPTEAAVGRILRLVKG